MTVKHSGKAYKVNVDVAAPVLTFKQSISKETGVPVGEPHQIGDVLQQLTLRAHEGAGQRLTEGTLRDTCI